MRLQSGECVGKEMSDELIEANPEFMGSHNGVYPGAFPLKVEERIRKIVASPCLHLFSGSSKIGDERIDISHPNATRNTDVFEFIKYDNRDWEFVLADPPYDLIRQLDYPLAKAITGDVRAQKLMADYLTAHTKNVLWFDYASPCPWGFEVYKFWAYRPGSWRKVRVLTWLKRKGERLQ